MNKIMIVALFFTITQLVSSQTTEKYDPIKTFEEAIITKSEKLPSN
jgi:hypothetical protein